MATKPSLCLIPSGYKANQLYSVLPSNGDGDFNFSREGESGVPNATRINKDGLIENVDANVPRLNYPLIDGVESGCPSFLLEPARTNYVFPSNDFTGWNYGNLYVTPNYALSPDGTQNASRCLFTDANQLISKVTSATGTVTGSMYVKGVQGETIQLSAGGGEDLITLNGEWQRLIVTKENINGGFNINTFGGATARDLLIYAAQLEVGSYATSYIPTQGTAQTRLADSCNDAGNEQVFNDSEGVLYLECSALSNIPEGGGGYITISSPVVSFTNALILQHRSNGQLRIYFGGTASANIQFIVSDFDWISNNKIAVQYHSIGSNYKLFINGVSFSRYSLATNQSVSGLSELNFNYSNTNFNGEVKDVRYYNTALTDSELQSLTQV